MNPNHKRYMDYGGRGITLCDEWKDDYETFKEWSYRNGYDESMPKGYCTIDRINVNGNYEPNNCRFISMQEQALNKRTNHFITVGDTTLTISQWAEKIGVTRSKLTYIARILGDERSIQVLTDNPDVSTKDIIKLNMK